MRNSCIFKNHNSLQKGPVSNLQTRCVRTDKGRKCVMLDKWYFLSIKYYHWSLLSWYLVAPKGAVFWFKAFFLTSPEVGPKPSQGARSSLVVLHLSCGVLASSNVGSHFLALLAWSFGLKELPSYVSLPRYSVLVSSTKELLVRERSLSTSLSVCEIQASSSLSYSIVSCHTW